MDDCSGDEELDVYIIESQNRSGYLRKAMMDRLKEKEKEMDKAYTCVSVRANVYTVKRKVINFCFFFLSIFLYY